MKDILEMTFVWYRLPLGMLVLGLTFGLVPGLVLNLAVLFYPKDHPRRRELVAEMDAVPYFKRALWVFQALQVTLTEGLPARVRSHRAARRKSSDKPDGPETKPGTSVKPATRVERDSKFDLDSDWFTPVTTTATSTLSDDFRAWRSEFPDFYDGSGYSSSLSITEQDVLVALGPQAGELMAAAKVDVDELIRLVNAETMVLPVIQDRPSRERRRQDRGRPHQNR